MLNAGTTWLAGFSTSIYKYIHNDHVPLIWTQVGSLRNTRCIPNGNVVQEHNKGMGVIVRLVTVAVLNGFYVAVT